MKVEIQSVTIAHSWDDESTTDYEVTVRRPDGDLGPYVALKSSGETIPLYPESWPTIRKQIDVLMKNLTGATNGTIEE